MKLNIRSAKKQLFANSKVYYVPSKSGGDEHIVVVTPKGAFCDCKDFMTRRLPLFGTAAFTHCTHVKQVTRFSFGHVKPEPAPAKQFGIFIVKNGGLKQTDLNGRHLFNTRREAQKEIDKHLSDGHKCWFDRRVFEIVNGSPVIKKTAKPAPKKYYGVFTRVGGYRSVDIPEIFESKALAERAIRGYEGVKTKYDRLVKEL